jgi:hypothetical protein
LVPFSCVGPRRRASVGLAVVGCFAHAVAGEGAPLLVTKCTPCHRPQLPRTRACADCGRLARRHPWRRPELCRVSRRVAPFAANAEPSHAVRPTCAHPSACPRTRVHAPLHREGAPAPPAEHRRRADVAVPKPATTSPRWPPPSSSRSFEPSNPRGSLEVIPEFRRRRGHPAPSFLFWAFRQTPWVIDETTGMVLCTEGHMLAWP